MAPHPGVVVAGIVEVGMMVAGIVEVGMVEVGKVVEVVVVRMVE